MDRLIWNDADYENISWHDNYIHAMSFDPDNSVFLLDIDHILEWVNPKQGESGFSFWISPATLCFREVSKLKIDVDIESVHSFDIYEIKREVLENKFRPETPIYNFKIVLGVVGYIDLKATGFEMHARQPAKHIEALSMTVEERGGISFAKIPQET